MCALQREGQSEQQQAVQHIHRHPCAPLHGIGVVLPKNRAFRVRSFRLLFVGLVESIQSKSGSLSDTAHPELYKWWMLRIDSKIVVLRVRDASGDVIGLINGEAVEAGCDGRTQGCESNQKQCKANKNIAFHDEEIRPCFGPTLKEWYVGHRVRHQASRIVTITFAEGVLIP